MKSEAYNSPRCPGTLKEGFTSYCPATRRKLFQGKQVFHVLDNSIPEKDWQNSMISGHHYGNQRWYNMSLVRNKMVPGIVPDYLLKTVYPGEASLRFHMEQMGNEHFCLQLASQIFGLETIENSLMFFPDGQPALICKTISKSENFKSFDSLWDEMNTGKPLRSYFQISLIADKFCAASLLVKERFFTHVLFNWVIANAGGYAKSAGLLKTVRGDLILAPLQSIICTRLHELGPDFSMADGLYDGDKNSNEYRENGCYTRSEFFNFGKRIAINEKRINKILDTFIAAEKSTMDLLHKAFLPDEAKATIRFNIAERIMRLK